MMVRTKKVISKAVSIVMVLSLIVCVIMAVSVTAFAETENSAVNDVSNSLIQVRLVYEEDNGKLTAIQGGTGFLINENTVLTCAHVVDVDNDTKNVLKDLYGEYKKDKLSLQVVVSGDVTITANIKKESQEIDFAVLTLTEAIYQRKVASLGDSDSVSPTQLVYALGFPASVARIQNKNTYTSSDVTITDGKISKLTSSGNVDFIQHGAILTEGNSGGPLVDESGAVVGINKGENSEGGYYYAIRINQVKDILDALGISYTTGTQTIAPTPTSAESSSETIVEAQTQAPTEIATEKAIGDISPTKKINTTTIIIIAAIVVLVVILVVVVILILAGNKKKSKKQSYSQPPQRPVAQQNIQRNVAPGQVQYNRPITPQGGSRTVTTNEGGSETTVLNDGNGETTVLGLGQQPSSVSTLKRIKTNERISINKPEFIIGKERRRVDYCISDNNSVSRAHAKFRIRAGKCYIQDLGSTNFTSVNGNKLSPNQEIELSAGDKIRISDEEFVFLG